MQNPDLFREVQQLAKHIADKIKVDETFPDQLTHLVFRHNAPDFTDGQMKTLWAFRDKLMEKRHKLDRVEVTILDNDDRNFYFMRGKI